MLRPRPRPHTGWVAHPALVSKTGAVRTTRRLELVMSSESREPFSSGALGACNFSARRLVVSGVQSSGAFGFSMVVVVVLGPSSAEAGPWSPASGTSYQQASVNALNVSDRDEFAAAYYGEFGLGGGWAFVGSVPVRLSAPSRDRPSGLPGEEFLALTPTAGLRYQFLRGPLVLALQSELGIPLSGGAYDSTSQLLAGTTLARGQVFLQTGVGLRLRSLDAGHEAIWSADAGVWLGRSVLAVASGRGRYQLAADPRARRPEVENRVGSQWLYRINGHVDVGFELLYTLPHSTVSEGISTTAYVAFWTGL